MIEIPYDQLSAPALQAIVEEFASRDGCEFTPLCTKSAQIEVQLRSGRLKIYFDAELETCQIVAV